MAFARPTSDGDVVPQMNVTPLVDVVLVLLVTFMVITPLLAKTFWIHTPEQSTEMVPRDQIDPDTSLVLLINRDGEIRINGIKLADAELPDRLRRIFAAREDHVLFFDSDGDVSYGKVMEILDRAREGGAVTLAMLTEPVVALP